MNDVPVNPGESTASHTEPAALNEALRMASRGLRLLLWALLPLYLGSGITAVRQHEKALPVVLGVFDGTVWEPGLHWTWPRPLAEVHRVETDRVRSLDWMPMPAASSDVRAPPPEENAWSKLLLTGDANLLRAHWRLQYRIHDPAAWLLRTAQPEERLKNEFAHAITRITAMRPADASMRSDVENYRAEVSDELRRRVESAGIGVSIERVEMVALRPPARVLAAFDDVIQAENERSEALSEARGYAARREQETAGESARRVAMARGDRERAVQSARADADSFAKLLPEYRARPDLVRRGLWQETIRRVAVRLKDRYILPPSGPGGREFRLQLGPEQKKPQTAAPPADGGTSEEM